MELPDIPAVRNMERTGYPGGGSVQWPVCPVCGAETDTLYKTGWDGEVVGCGECIETVDAWEEG